MLAALWIVLSLLTIFSAVQLNLSGNLVTGSVTKNVNVIVDLGGSDSDSEKPVTYDESGGSSVSVPLKKGWNLVSSPFLTLEDVSGCNLHNEFFYYAFDPEKPVTYSDGTVGKGDYVIQKVVDPKNMLPGISYLAYAWEDCTLVYKGSDGVLAEDIGGFHNGELFTVPVLNFLGSTHTVSDLKDIAGTCDENKMTLYTLDPAKGKKDEYGRASGEYVLMDSTRIEPGKGYALYTYNKKSSQEEKCKLSGSKF